MQPEWRKRARRGDRIRAIGEVGLFWQAGSQSARSMALFPRTKPPAAKIAPAAKRRFPPVCGLQATCWGSNARFSALSSATWPRLCASSPPIWSRWRRGARTGLGGRVDAHVCRSSGARRQRNTSPLPPRGHRTRRQDGSVVSDAARGARRPGRRDPAAGYAVDDLRIQDDAPSRVVLQATPTAGSKCATRDARSCLSAC